MTFLLAALADRLDATRPEVILGLLVLVTAQVLLVLAIRARARRARGNRAPLARPRPPGYEGDPPPGHEPADEAPEDARQLEAAGIANPSSETAEAATVLDSSRPRPPREYMREPAAAPAEVAPPEAQPPQPESREPAPISPSAEPVAPSVVTGNPATAPRGPRVGTALITCAAATALVAALLLYLTRTRESRS